MPRDRDQAVLRGIPATAGAIRTGFLRGLRTGSSSAFGGLRMTSDFVNKPDKHTFNHAHFPCVSLMALEQTRFGQEYCIR